MSKYCKILDQITCFRLLIFTACHPEDTFLVSRRNKGQADVRFWTASWVNASSEHCASSKGLDQPRMRAKRVFGISCGQQGLDQPRMRVVCPRHSLVLTEALETQTVFGRVKGKKHVFEEQQRSRSDSDAALYSIQWFCKRRPRSDCADAQSDLGLRWAHRFQSFICVIEKHRDRVEVQDDLSINARTLQTLFDFPYIFYTFFTSVLQFTTFKWSILGTCPMYNMNISCQYLILAWCTIWIFLVNTWYLPDVQYEYFFLPWPRKLAICFAYLLMFRFYGPVNQMWACRARSFYLNTLPLGRFSTLTD